MESSKKKRNSVLPIIVSVGIATSMGVVASSTPEVAYASSNAASTSAATSASTYADRSGSDYDENQIINIPDAALKKKLLAAMKGRQLIDGNATDITIGAAGKLDWVELRCKYGDSNTIHDLTGLGYFKNLWSLELDYNKVSDLTPLSNLTNLKELYFSGNQVSDLTPLKNLTNLKKLDFYKNQVSDLTPLSGLTNLKELFFLM